jgi:hypothetical protein
MSLVWSSRAVKARDGVTLHTSMTSRYLRKSLLLIPLFGSAGDSTTTKTPGNPTCCARAWLKPVSSLVGQLSQFLLLLEQGGKLEDQQIRG